MNIFLSIRIEETIDKKRSNKVLILNPNRQFNTAVVSVDCYLSK